MMNEERYIAIYFDWDTGKQTGGFMTYDELLEEYHNDKEMTDAIWERSYPIPADTDEKTFTDYYKNGIVDTYTMTFKELREACGWGDAVEYWYGLLRGC